MSAVSLLKTLWEKEKLLVTSNFSFSHSVFYSFEKLSTIFMRFKIVVCNFFEFGRVKKMSFGKGLKGHSTCEPVCRLTCWDLLIHNSVMICLMTWITGMHLDPFCRSMTPIYHHFETY